MISAKLLQSRISLKRQLLIIFIASLLFLSIVGSVITSWQTGRKIKATTVNDGLQIADNFAAQSLLALLTASEENAREAVGRALGFHDLRGVAIFKKNSDLLFSAHKKKNSRFPAGSFSCPDKRTPQILAEYENHWLLCAPVLLSADTADPIYGDLNSSEPESEIVGYVLVEYSKQGLQDVRKSIVISNLAIGIAIAIVLAILIRIAVRRMLEPLSSLSLTMQNSRDSGGYIQAEVSGAREIRRMAEIYNQMIQRLEKQSSELELHRANLESEVNLRTKELVVARDSAMTASRHKSEFLANISHELRTPLQAIIGYIDIVQEELELDGLDAQAEDLSRAVRSANILLSLINSILDLAKVEAGRMDVNIQLTNVDDLVNETLDTIRPMAAANNNELLVNRKNTNCSVNIDRQKMMQIFLNLLSNACKFTKDGKIVFDVKITNNMLVASVEDTGIGISDDKLDLIFEPFTQLEGGQSRRFEGTGLGMAITRNFCQMIGADIAVSSTLGQGTCFRLSLPLS